MATLHRGPNWRIAIYGREHGIPHFHIEGPGYRCSVAIGGDEPIAGSAPRRVLIEACAWARENRALAMKAWRELNG